MSKDKNKEYKHIKITIIAHHLRLKTEANTTFISAETHTIKEKKKIKY